MSLTRTHLDEAKRIIDALDASVIDRMAEALAALRQRDGRLFFLGVGGSAGNCSHAVNDFRKIVGIEAYAPTDNVSELTARTNDEGWETVFAEWLKVSRLKADDALFIFSVGGGNLEKNVSPQPRARAAIREDGRRQDSRRGRPRWRLHRPRLATPSASCRPSIPMPSRRIPKRSRRSSGICWSPIPRSSCHRRSGKVSGTRSRVLKQPVTLASAVRTQRRDWLAAAAVLTLLGGRVCSGGFRPAAPDAVRVGHCQRREQRCLRSPPAAGGNACPAHERSRGAGLADGSLVRPAGRTILAGIQSAALESLQRLRHAARRIGPAAAVFSAGHAAVAAPHNVDLQSFHHRAIIPRRLAGVSVRAAISDNLPSLVAAITFMLSGYFIVYLNMPHLSVEVLTPGLFLIFEILLREETWGRPRRQRRP